MTRAPDSVRDRGAGWYRIRGESLFDLLHQAECSSLPEVRVRSSLYEAASGVPLSPSSGPGQYMKLGMNRWGDGPGGAPEDTWIIYYDDLRIGDDQARFEDVAP